MADQNRLNYKLAAFVGAEIKRRRTELGMSQRKVADATFLGNSTISYYETGAMTPGLDSLCHVAKALGCDPGDLLPTGAALLVVLGADEHGVALELSKNWGPLPQWLDAGDREVLFAWVRGQAEKLGEEGLEAAIEASLNLSADAAIALCRSALAPKPDPEEASPW